MRRLSLTPARLWLRFWRAVRFWRYLRYSWRLAWIRAERP